jgi:membrane associated rhomboid family serine protease
VEGARYDHPVMDERATVADPTPTCYRHPDRPTLVSCSSCERPICTSCMVQAAVGVKCPECAGRPTGAARLKPRPVARGTAYVTMTLIAINVAVFVLQSLTDTGSVGRGVGGDIAANGWLDAPNVADGDWWRIVTSAFLHAGIAHLAFNMIALWYLGTALESYVGPLRFSVIYLGSVLWGSAGALLFAPLTPTVGASGGVFGIMAAILVLQRQRGVSIVADVGIWLGINLVITFTLPGISIGGHLGGIVGGAVTAWALSSFGTGHMAARTLTPVATVGAVAVLVLGVVVSLYAAERKAPSSSASAVTTAALVRTAPPAPWAALR